jgi:uncharacterized transporter YbjL
VKNKLSLVSEEEKEDVEIEYLPTLGEAYSTKTIKQGRKLKTQQEKIFDDIMSGSFTRSSTSRSLFSKRRSTLSLNDYKVMCARIIRFEKSTEKEKEVARKLIEHINTREVKTKKELEEAADNYRLVKILDTKFRQMFHRKYLNC